VTLSTSAFTAHNVRLDDGTFTIPAQSWDMSRHPVFLDAQRLLQMLYPRNLAGKRLVDVGCLEGGYTVEFARCGLEALGIEVRHTNFENCLRVKAGVNLTHLSFVCDDAWNINEYGAFDVVFCCGLLYHLDRPRLYLGYLAEACREVLIINTHFADKENRGAHNLSEVTEHEGLRGRWFTEYPDDNTKREDAKWSAWGNVRSFWPFRDDLADAIRTAGFGIVLEQFGSGSWKNWTDRATFVAIKDGYSRMAT
jgi:SAM-dependent methyltransferase